MALPASVTLTSFPFATVSPRRGNGQNRLGGQPIVGIVVGRQVVARIFGFSLSPNLFGPVGIIFVGKNEVDALCGFALIADFDVEFVTWMRGRRRVER